MTAQNQTVQPRILIDGVLCESIADMRDCQDDYVKKCVYFDRYHSKRLRDLTLRRWRRVLRRVKCVRRPEIGFQATPIKLPRLEDLLCEDDPVQLLPGEVFREQIWVANNPGEIRVDWYDYNGFDFSENIDVSDSDSVESESEYVTQAQMDAYLEPFYDTDESDVEHESDSCCTSFSEDERMAAEMQAQEEEEAYQYDRFEQEYFYWSVRMNRANLTDTFMRTWCEAWFSDQSSYVFFGWNPCLKRLFDDEECISDCFEPSLFETVNRIDFAWLAKLIQTWTQAISFEAIPSLNDLGGTMTSIMEFVLRNSAQWATNPLTAISSVVEAFIGKISAMSVQACWNAFFKEIVLVMSSVILILVGKFLGVPKLFISIAYMILTVTFAMGANGVNKKTIITLTVINVVFAMGTSSDGIDDYIARKISLQGPLDILPRVVFLLAAVCFGHMLPSSTDFLTMLRKFDALPKAILGIEKLADMLTGSFDMAADVFYKHIYGHERPKVSAIPEEVEKNYAEVLLFDYDKMSRVPSDPILCAKLGDLWHEYMSFRQKYASNTIVRNFLNAYQGNIQKFYDKASTTNPKPMEQRLKPVGIFLFGGSGVGKSTLINFINVNILRRKGLITDETLPEEIERLMNTCVYARAREQEFWDRYQNQLICVYDDIFQLKDHDQMPNEEYFEMIRAINTFAYPLHKAELSEKANSYFTSEFFVGSTNLRVIKPKSTVETSATLSRMHLNFAIRIKKQYRKDEVAEFSWNQGNNAKFGIDAEKVLRLTGDAMSLDVYEVYEWDPETGAIRDDQDSLSLEEMELSIWKKHLSHAETKMASTKMLVDYARRLKLGAIPIERLPVSQEAVSYGVHEPSWIERDDGLQRSFESWSVWLGNRGFPLDFCEYIESFAEGDFDSLYSAIEAITVTRPGRLRSLYHNFSALLERRADITFQSSRDLMIRSVIEARLKSRTIYDKTLEFVKSHASVLTGLTAIVGILGAAYAWHRSKAAPEQIEIVRSAPIELECLHDLDTSPVFYQTRDGGIKIVAIDDGLTVNGKQFEWTAFENCDVMICTKSMSAQIFKDIGAECVEKPISITKCAECIPKEVSSSGLSVVEVIYESGTSKMMNQKMNIESGTSKAVDMRKYIESGIAKNMQSKVDLESGVAKQVAAKVVLESDARIALESFHSHQSMEITRVVRQAYGFIVTNEGRYVCPVLNVGGRVALTNLHYWNRVPDEFKYKLPYGKNAYFQMKKCDVRAKMFERKVGQESDVVILTWPRVVPVTRDLMKSFVDQDQLGELVNSQFVLLSPGLYDDHGAQQTFMHKNGVVDRVEVTSRDVVELGRKMIGLEVYSRDCRTEPGDCGGVYVLDDNRFRGKICAMHFAGQLTGGAVGAIITKQDLEKFKDIELECSPYDPSCEELPVEGVLFHGRTPPAPLPVVSGFEPTKVKGKIDDCGTEPVKLSKFLLPNGPGVLGLRKVGGFVYRPDDVPLKMAVDSYSEKIFCGQPHEEYEKRVLSFEEAAGGIEGTPFVRGVNRSRSPGYPWVLQKGGNKGKRQWLGNDEWTFGEQCQPLRDAVNRKINAAERGTWNPSPYIDALKDETRPRGKKTRVFSMAAQELVITLRMYFLGFFSYLMRNRIDNELAVGIRAQSLDWHRLSRKLTSKGPNVIAGDFTDYDGNLNPSFLWIICDMANRWYNDGNDTVRNIIWLDVVNSMHVAGDFLYQWSHSQPSGNPGTAIINSIANSLMCRYVYYSLALHADKIVPFNSVVEMVSYGDDNVLNVSGEVIEWFNQLTMSEVFPIIGMTYTDADKTEIQRPCVTIHEASFLKRGFRQENGIWYGPLERKSINNRLEWQKKGSNMETLIENAKAAIAEWALHCDEEFEYWSRRIQTIFMDELNISLPVNHKQDYLDLVRSGKMEQEFPFLCFA